MKVSKLVAELKQFNPDAEVLVVVHNKEEQFSIAFSGAFDGAGKSHKDSKCHIYVDDLNNMEGA
jgi:uncharacterized protein YbdZ (MbtH family)